MAKSRYLRTWCQAPPAPTFAYLDFTDPAEKSFVPVAFHGLFLQHTHDFARYILRYFPLWIVPAHPPSMPSQRLGAAKLMTAADKGFESKLSTHPCTAVTQLTLTEETEGGRQALIVDNGSCGSIDKAKLGNTVKDRERGGRGGREKHASSAHRQRPRT